MVIYILWKFKHQIVGDPLVVYVGAYKDEEEAVEEAKKRGAEIMLAEVK